MKSSDHTFGNYLLASACALLTGFASARAGTFQDIVTSLHTAVDSAVELRFNAPDPVMYQIESSTNLVDWTVVEGSIAGGNGPANRYYSIDHDVRRYYRVRTASGDPHNQGMALIPAGEFQMGDPFNEGSTAERPVHPVYVSAFYMDKYEVTKALWDEVRTWALANGYNFSNTGLGNAANHPVHTVNWYDCVKWCNARSEKVGLTPAYYTDTARTVVNRTGEINLGEVNVNWTGGGYRLPTEAEWEKAARGGLAGQRFPWGANITHAEANYYSLTSYAYDTSPTRGFHPTYATGSQPYTSPVGSFAANGYGLFDMAGNLIEWNWDWYGSGHFASSPGTDPLGPTSGSYRMLRGSSWLDNAYGARSASRGYFYPDFEYDSVGFRCVR